MIKKIFFVFALCIFLTQVSAVSVNSDKNDFFLGEKISFSGGCQGTQVDVSASIEEKKILEQKTLCFEGTYSIEIQALQSYPSGNWKFSFSDSSGSAFLNSFASPLSETTLLALNVLSPTSETIKRNQELDLSLRVFFNNALFSDANVFYWLPNGSVAQMQGSGEGIFNATIIFPSDFSAKEWNLFIVAYSPEKNLRGQVKKTFKVEGADIIISVVEPSSSMVEAGVSQRFFIEAAYSDGAPLAGPIASVDFGKGFIEMPKSSEKGFSFEKVFSESEIGAKKIVFQVRDSSGNFASKEFSFFVEKGFWLDFANALSFVPYALAGIVLLGAVFFFARKYSAKKGSAKRALAIKREIKELQAQYFKNREISEDFYRQELNRLSLELSQLEKNLNKAKSKDK